MSDLILRFTGVVSHAGSNPDKITIGGASVLGPIESLIGIHTGKKVIVQIEDDRYEGEPRVQVGEEGYSSWTPGLNALFYIGREDLLQKLIDLDGETITLTVGFPD
jgi:hypothetical protein